MQERRKLLNTSLLMDVQRMFKHERIFFFFFFLVGWRLFQYNVCGMMKPLLTFPLHFIKGSLLLFLFCRIIFAPLWLFHVVVARGRFSLPAPSLPHDRHVWDTVSNDFFGYHFYRDAIDIIFIEMQFTEK